MNELSGLSLPFPLCIWSCCMWPTLKPITNEFCWRSSLVGASRLSSAPPLTFLERRPLTLPRLPGARWRNLNLGALPKSQHFCLLSFKQHK